MRKWLVLMLLLVPVSASAFTGTANEIVVQDGTVGFANTPIRVNEGGTGRSTLTANALLVGAGTTAVSLVSPGTAGRVLLDNGAGVDPSFGAVDLADTDAVTGVLPLGNGGTGASSFTANRCIRSNAGGTALEVSGSDCAAAVPSLIGFSSNMDVVSSTVYAAPGVSETSQVRAQTQAANAITLDNLRCVASTAPGGSETFTITMADGGCTAALTDSTQQVCTISATSRVCAESGTGEAVAQGDCFAFSIAPSASAATAVVSCTAEITG